MPQQLSQLIFPVAIIAAFWFLIIRPQQQRAKTQAQMLSQLVEGEEIITIGGIYGEVLEVGEERIRIATIDGSELEIAKAAVRSVIPAETEDDVDEAEDAEPDSDDEAQTDAESAEEPSESNPKSLDDGSSKDDA
ncbi:MAG: preprotein translocase subunit YajC [Coriobacteriia bacterium]|nr:preprotein translocase subunit YajC [Coriobacteriia bacterium]